MEPLDRVQGVERRHSMNDFVDYRCDYRPFWSRNVVLRELDGAGNVGRKLVF
jgi:hypothetical protein